MKFKICLKDPDGVDDSLYHAAYDSIPEDIQASEMQRHELVKEKQTELANVARQWLQYGEFVTIEIDTEAGTAVVCKANRD